MRVSPFRKGIPWLIVGLLLLLVSLFLFLYDMSRADDEIMAEIEQGIQEDFENCIAYYSQDPSARGEKSANCIACELVYNGAGRLISWTENEYLPAEGKIDRLKSETFPETQLVSFGNRSYFQIREASGDSTLIYLIPLYIDYNVSNNFLIPYLYLGRHKEQIVGGEKNKHIQQIFVMIGGEDDPSADTRLRGPDGSILYRLSGVPPIPFRAGIRYTVLVFLLLGGISLCLYLRIYAIQRKRYRYLINIALFFTVIVLRVIFYWVNLPGDYIDANLFEADIVAFHDLAPNLGEMTINIFTVAVLVWIIYTHLFRQVNPFYRKLIRNHFLAWPAMFVTIALSSLLFFGYVKLFQAINLASQIDLEFTNLFKADVYSFLILLDAGIVLLTASLISFLFLKLNIYYGQRYRLNASFIAFQLLSALVCNLYLYQTEPSWVVGIIITVVLFMLGWTLYRFPFKPILHQDLVNYLIITLAFSLILTHSIIDGINTKNSLKAEQIAQVILGSQVKNTTVAYTISRQVMNNSLPEIRDSWRTIDDPSKFREWLLTTYLEPNFKEFEIHLFLYDTAENRLDISREIEPAFGPESDIVIQDQGDSIAQDLYLIPNTENQYLDIFVGTFKLSLERQDTTTFHMELIPSGRETEGLYPSLSLEEEVYEEIKLINSFDYAVYRKGVLYNESGETPFPLVIQNHDKYLTKFINAYDEYYEYIEPIENNKLAVVRYPRQGFLEVLTTFSFIFYFLIVAALLLIGLPVMVLRTLRINRINYRVPLRTKIRLGLLAISVSPMIVIIALLSPFITQRYNEEARMELSEDAARITQVVGQNYRNLRNDRFSRFALRNQFLEKIEELEAIVRNDINIFDENGKRVASTQPLVFEAGISSELMNAEAFTQLKSGAFSDLVHKERLGELEYMSAYRPILGNDEKPIGYVNIPYLAKQDQLDEQVVDFLAYLANIYLLVFLLLNVIAIVVSGTITQPLTMIQQKLSSTILGDINEPIDYKADDEIGAIVGAYNQMIDQLGESEKKLTQTQRELAWRQMARQVAHEIKNPLTPMKLSIQHLSRAWDEKTPRLQKMFPKVMKTLLVQIESMVRIANSFSEFAKMPDPVKTRIKVNDVLLEVVDLYTQSEEAIWLIDIPKEEFWSYTDRDQLSRCFNNIIKNGLQAVEESGIMHISMRVFPDHARIEIKDNGKGMDEEVQKRLFEPSFSTKTSGMGLGLAIVKRIIENSGGDISFTSKLDEGTTFTIKLPAAETDEEQGQKTQAWEVSKTI